MENTKCSVVGWLSSWTPVLFCAGFIFYLSSLSHPSVPKFPYSDKVFHIIAYGGLGFLTARAFRHQERGWMRWKVVTATCLVAVLYGISDEFHQSFVPLRSVEVADVLAYGIGGLLGSLSYWMVSYVYRSRLSP